MARAKGEWSGRFDQSKRSDEDDDALERVDRGSSTLGFFFAGVPVLNSPLSLRSLDIDVDDLETVVTGRLLSSNVSNGP